VTYAKFDAQGHTTQINDATGASRYYSYDAQGRLAKEWQTVTITEANGYAAGARSGVPMSTTCWATRPIPLHRLKASAWVR
jgi:YD repeat-containing protein